MYIHQYVSKSLIPIQISFDKKNFFWNLNRLELWIFGWIRTSGVNNGNFFFGESIPASLSILVKWIFRRRILSKRSSLRPFGIFFPTLYMSGWLAVIHPETILLPSTSSPLKLIKSSPNTNAKIKTSFLENIVIKTDCVSVEKLYMYVLSTYLPST